MLDKRPSTDVLNNCEMFYVRMHQFFSFIVETHLEDDANLDIGQIENIFSIVDAPDKATAANDPHNVKLCLNRHEWLQVLVRLAMRKFCHLSSRGTSVGNCADAVEQLCTDNLIAFLPRACLINPNDFRKASCYREQTDAVLREHRQTLCNLFEVYSALANGGMHNEALLVDKTKLGLGEWMTFVQHTGLMELGMVTWQVAMQAFAWSRVRSAKSWSNAQECRMRHLMWEDFLEALVRLASIIALPTDDEVEAANAADAGEFMLALYVDARDAFRQFVSHRTIGWTERNTTQQIHKCVAHLLALIRRVLFANLTENADKSVEAGTIGKGTVDKFYRRRYVKGSGQPRGLAVPTKHAVSGEAVTLAMAQVSESIFRALRSVLAFDRLSDDDIRTLQGAMGSATFRNDEYVFEQGDEGDYFYLITSGEAEVLHFDPSTEDQEEILLNVITTSACFGEKALIGRAPRNASIMAKGTLKVNYISRDEFEAALGRSLASLQLSHEQQDELRKKKEEQAPTTLIDKLIEEGPQEQDEVDSNAQWDEGDEEEDDSNDEES